MTRTRALLGPLAAIPLAALTLAACGGSDSNPPAASVKPVAPAGGNNAVDVANSSLGRILVDPRGRTLYLFEKDTGPKSTCSGPCAAAWPPYRANGRQVVYAGHPLYYYAGDQSPGETNGEGLTQFGAAWYVVSPSGSPIDNS